MGYLHVIPEINGNVKLYQDYFILEEKIDIENPCFEEWCTEAFLLRTGRKTGGKSKISVVKEMSVPKEGYLLRITKERVVITASHEQGVIWAFTTLAALLEEDRLPCCEICDGPEYEHRGISLDCARHFYTAEEVKKIIEEISLVKMNVFHWHLEDDQGWRIESLRYPKLHETSGDYYTQREIREICRFAKIRGVEVIPEIEIPGHARGILAAYPQYSCSGRKVSLAVSGGIYPIILCAGRSEVMEFLENLFDEILPLFPGERVHLGGDEAPKDEWKKCPYCNARMKKQGLKNYEQLQGELLTQVSEILKKHGKTAIFWNEALLSDHIPKEIQIQYWTLNHRKSMEEYAKTGGKWIYSDMFELYFDYPYSMTPLRKVYDTIPHLGEKLIKDHEELRKGLLGMEACLWSEHIKDDITMEKRLFPRVCALAEIAWCKACDYDGFTDRLRNWIEKSAKRSIRYTEEDHWVPTGIKRQKEALSYMAALTSAMSDEVKEQTVNSSAPGEEFGRAFFTKFFQPEDIPFLTGKDTMNEK